MSAKSDYYREWAKRNRDKRKAAQARWDAKNMDKVRAGDARRARRRWQRRREIIDAIKSRPCVDCGGAFPPCCMDFDHRDASSKVDIIAKLGSFPGGFEALKDEIAKCDVVCANCHRIRTFNRRREMRAAKDKAA